MIGDSKWINKFKDISSKYNLYEIIYRLQKQINKINDIKQIFYLSTLLTHLQINKNLNFNINIDNMILLKPDYNFLNKDEILDDCNIKFKFSLSLKDKKVNLTINKKKLNYENFLKINEEFIVLVRDFSKCDNLILIIPSLNLSGGKYVYSNNTVNYPGMQAGIGYDNKIHTSKGFQIGQNAPSVDIDNVPDNLQNHNSSQYPADPLFGVKKLEGLIMEKKKGINSYQNGFSNGFDNGYNKGYYFGYSSAAAYLYRYYKKFYKSYMEKYRQKLVEKQMEEMEDLKEDYNEEYDMFQDEEYIDSDEYIYEDNEMYGGWFFGNDDDMKASLVKNELTRLTGQDFNLDPIFQKDSLKELENEEMYKGLPDYMMPENTFTLQALQPRNTGLMASIANFFLPLHPSEDPDKHCYKPKQEDLNHMLSLNFHPKFRDAIISADKNWDEVIFRKSCNQFSLKLKKYCPTENHIGVEYDHKIGAFYKSCKLKKDEKSGCSIM